MRIKGLLGAAFCLVVIFSFALQGEAYLAVGAKSAITVPIIMYHSILKDEARACRYIVSPETFRADMEYLLREGYETVFLSELADFCDFGAPLPEKPLVVTFDDGFLNVLGYVLPILEQLDMKAVVSVVGEYTQSYSESGDANLNYAYLTWADIRTLNESGRFEIGSHSYALHRQGTRNGCRIKPGEDGDSYERLLADDLMRLQTALRERSGVTAAVFAYPFGSYCKRSSAVLKALGFRAALLCEEKLNYLTGDPQELFTLGRFNRPAGISTEDFMRKRLP